MDTLPAEERLVQTIINKSRTNGINGSDNIRPSLNELIHPISKRYHDKVAVVCGDKSLTFQELDAFANRLSQALIHRGFNSGDLVGVALDRCVELIAVLLGVLRTGAAYVPIEPTLPVERVKQMMENACPKLIITDTETSDIFASLGDWCFLSLEEALQTTSTSEDGVNDDVLIQSDDLAYVMYTSGSTGQPKGVEITHGGLANLLVSMQKEPGCNETDRLLAITTVSFDMAVVDCFLPLSCGATTIIAQRHELLDMKALVGLMERHQITIMQGTPTIWQMMVDSGWQGLPRLKKIFSAGEALPRTLADRLMDYSDEVWNLYGATEASVYSSMWRVCHDHDVIIGGPIGNTHLYVLNDDLSPVSAGSPGELCIGGLGVGRGYHNNSKLSRARFVNNPFHPGLLYRTGDVARFIASDKLSVLGRIDGQVKIRGHRIELGDIEAAITAHASISAAIVISRDDRLVAYYLKKVQPLRNGNSEACSLALTGGGRHLRYWVAERLPSYMVPAFFVEVDAFPLSINGKIDRKALPDPITTSETSTSAMIPATGLEGYIFRIWSKVLGHDRLSINDNFFEIGGDSLRLVRVRKELEILLGQPVQVAKLFEHFTIKTLAAYLSGSANAPRLKSIPSQQFHTDGNQDIAIVSMSCRLPGGINSPEQFWELLDTGGDAIRDVPEGRWSDDLRPDAQSNMYCRCGGFVESINSFDISFFGISPREARRLDPSQYMLLEVCWEAFERAGYTMEKLRGSRTGVYIGASNISSHNSLNPGSVQDLEDLDGYTVSGSAGGTMSGRISYFFGLQGPTMTVDTACSSSLVATHLSCTALRQGECDMAVTGGITLMLNPGLHAEFSQLQGMSPDGHCRSFSADAEGTGWSEGSVVVMLKRLSAAQRDGDRIYGVIRGTAVNHDGRSATLTAPSGPSQQQVIRTALATARLQPNDIDYIEAHGTATKLGDPIEGAALAEVFGPSRAIHPLLVGAAKSNIGHTQAASGLVGLLKAVLALQHSTLPQTLHVANPTPAVDWQGANMALVLNKQSWLSRDNRLRRAGISAFGIGGTNAHIVVEEPPKQPVIPANARLPGIVPFLVSGDTDKALRRQAERLYRHINTFGSEDNLGDIAFSLACTRSHLRRRLVLVAQDKDELLEKLHLNIHEDLQISTDCNEVATEPRLAMLFTGQGSQWPGMGRDLCEVYSVFDNTLREIASIFDTELAVPLLDVMWAEPKSSSALLLDRTDFAQPALFALGVALWRLWHSWNVKPDFVLGHSLGELTVAHIAGILTLPDACRLVAARGRLMQAQTGDYSMVSLETSAAEVAATIERMGHAAKVDIAAYNTPTQTVISGHQDGIENITSHFNGKGHRTKKLVVGHAFHSRCIEDMLADYQAVAETIQFNPPLLKIISSQTGTLAKTGELENAQYWVKQAREPVRFSDGIQVLVSESVNVVIELGPDQVLCGMGAMCVADRNQTPAITWLPSLSPRNDGVSMLQQCLAHLHIRNVPIDWQAYFKPFGYQRAQLPTYSFQREYTLPHTISKPLIRPDRNRAGIANGISGVNSIENGYPRGNITRNQFEVVWHSVKTDNVRPKGVWGLIIETFDSKWTATTMKTLSQAGIQFIQVDKIGDAAQMNGLICLWDLRADVIPRAKETMTKALAQLQTAAQTNFAPPLIWITHHTIGLGGKLDNSSMFPGPGSLLWGLMRTARSEHPELHLRLLDFDHETSKEGVISALMQDTEPECAVRQDQVFVPRLQRVDACSKPTLVKDRLLRQDGAVLITGGLGDLGSRVARWLVSHHGVCDLVLTSRHGMECPGANELVAELLTLGAKATVLNGDVANQDIVRSIMVMFNKDRPLRGIVHAAGVIDSGVLSTMTPERCETTIVPKVHGAWNLHQATRDMDLDLFMMFSSISGVMGMPGLANYAASNTFLDALAYFRYAQGLPATSIAYGTWAGDGMASKLGTTTLNHLSQYGLDPLTPEEGLELFEQAVVSRRPLTMAAVLDLERLRAYVEEQGGDIPPLLSSLLNRERNGRQGVSAGKQNLREVLSHAEPREHGPIVLKMTRQVVAKALGFTNPFDVDIDRPLKEIGIDSLTAVQMRNHLATLTGLALSVNIVFMCPSLRALSQSLLDQLQESDISSTAKTSDSRLEMKAICKGCLDRSFIFDKAAREQVNRFAERPGSVFLTGATGFVGAFILSELLKQGITTYCLVRASSVDKAQQRLMSTLREYDLWEPKFAPLIKPIIGDLTQPLLGMTDQVFDDLADRVDTICHSGAQVDWLRPLEDYVSPNIVSAHEVLRLASRGRAKAVHLVSTISTLPFHMGLSLDESDVEFGYGTSKYLAEKLVAAARWRGARASIYRLPYVTASTETGHFRRDRGDFLHNLIKGSIEMGAFPLIDADMSLVLPVDYLAKTMVTIITQESLRLGQDFDFLRTQAPTCSDFFKQMGAISGQGHIDVIPFSMWKEQALEYAGLYPGSPLARITAVLDGYTDESATLLFESLPGGDNVLGGVDHPAPLMDEVFIAKYLDRISSHPGNPM